MRNWNKIARFARRHGGWIEVSNKAGSRPHVVRWEEVRGSAANRLDLIRMVGWAREWHEVEAVMEKEALEMKP